MNKNFRLFGIAAAASALLTAGGVLAIGSGAEANRDRAAKPTVVLVHGAFADSSGWSEVTRRLRDDGYPVVAAANPLRGVSSDAASVRAFLESIDGPIVLVGHSYGGSVISTAATGDPDVKALVFVAAFSPEQGESAFDLSSKFPGSTLGETLTTVGLPDGNVDLYVDQKRFPDQFAADVPKKDAALMAVAQRPVTAAALNEGAGEPAWHTIPSYQLIAEADKNIPARVQHFMADRAHAVTESVKGASHAVFVSRPGPTAAFIERAARETA
ncbi:alpha/beta hydrolase [Asanoa ishikariensis]|uniref:Pimeloyl-ACP methyl ester carboxylesterase n=1 Tax=Asanoa ishikariensis TaxID=137265 RepID=A0A1H3UY28_9ACTN|nr:alpha/beta hydrolase [Asanoa ishikariensis]GIF70008.1 alpha/beta hydrolase [Asanoa ishikariensis]SDZ67238.1 Pimeloyl-ACP methyl ester carboxylesterase [Asanoa ishikariensis]